MKKLLALLLAMVMVLGLFAACGGSADEGKDDEKETTAAPEETDTNTPEQSEEETEPSVDANARTLVAKVEDQDGNPMAGVMLQYCDENGCSPVFTQEDGAAKMVTPAEKTVKVMEMPEGYDYATEQTEWDFTEGDEVTIVLKAVEAETPVEDTTAPEA